MDFSYQGQYGPHSLFIILRGVDYYLLISSNGMAKLMVIGGGNINMSMNSLGNAYFMEFCRMVT